jgi:hypothetical protein
LTVSKIVGTSGKRLDRSRAIVAIGRVCPDLMKIIAESSDTYIESSSRRSIASATSAVPL